MLRFFKTYAVGSLAALSLGASVQAASWDMPTPYPDATFHTVNIQQFAKEVSEKSGGQLTIKVHSAGSLFKHPEIKNAVRNGQVPIGEFFLSLLANENPAFGIDSQPFLATNYDDAQRLWNAQKPVVDRLLDSQGLMVLYAVPWPPQGLYTKKEVASVADLKGMKFRTNNAVLEKLATLAGAAPTQIEVPDIPQAFATGRVEAMITSPSTGANSKAWDYLNHFYDTQAWVPKNIVVVNKRAFQRLDSKTQAAVKEAAAAAEKRGWEMSKKETAEKIAVLKANGIKVHTPTPELMKGLKDIGAKMIAEWKVSAGKDGEAILSKY
ncbi:MAG: TRAP transporter substrate-binding protein [Burkholderiaceae bacterium]|jgi:TRAP-type C4-dicarboxylate transport system substrate-binding protein